THNHEIQLQLEGQAPNRFGLGAKVTVFAGTQAFYQEQSPTRGFQSSVDYVLTFGLGARDSVDSVRVQWPGEGAHDGRVSVVRSVAADHRITVRQTESSPAPPAPPRPPPILADVT